MRASALVREIRCNDPFLVGRAEVGRVIDRGLGDVPVGVLLVQEATDNLGHTIEGRERDEDNAAGLVCASQSLTVDVGGTFLVKPNHFARRALPLLPPALERLELQCRRSAAHMLDAHGVDRGGDATRRSDVDNARLGDHALAPLGLGEWRADELGLHNIASRFRGDAGSPGPHRFVETFAGPVRWYCPVR
jgi:hypothetical protein